MEAASQFRSYQDSETDDLAFDYIEHEVGRHDWANNWPKHKARHGAELPNRIKEWLDRLAVRHDPQALIDYLDRLVRTRPGRWQ